MSGLEGKVAIVTGAARHRGIGRGIALRLARDGARVVAIGSPRPPERFPEDERAIGWRGSASIAAEIEALGGAAIGIDADLTKASEAERIVAETLAKFDRIDVLVNNAGLGIAGERNLSEIDDQEWYDVVNVNLNAVYLLTSRVMRSMVEANAGGRIINISSAAGRIGVPQYGAYCATKFGVIGLTQMLAIEAAPHQITVNCVAPGSVDTDMMDGTFAHMAARFHSEPGAMKQAVVRSIPPGPPGPPGRHRQRRRILRLRRSILDHGPDPQRLRRHTDGLVIGSPVVSRPSQITRPSMTENRRPTTKIRIWRVCTLDNRDPRSTIARNGRSALRERACGATRSQRKEGA